MNKQIEEMAKIICPCLYGDNDCESCDLYEDYRCLPFDIAKEIDNREYRKATDVATDFFEEFEALIAQKDTPITVTALLATKEYADFKKKWAKL